MCYLYKEKYTKDNSTGKVTSFTREDFFGEETSTPQLRTIDGEGVMAYVIKNSARVNLEDV